MLSTVSSTSRVIAICIAGAAIAHSASAATLDDACAVLTPAQVSAAVGAAVGVGTYIMPTFKKTCTWTTAANGGRIVTLNLQSLSQFQGEKKSASYGQPLVAIGGIGDEAYWFGAGSLVSIIAKKGDVAVKVSVYARIPIEQRQAAEKALAMQAVSRL